MSARPTRVAIRPKPTGVARPKLVALFIRWPTLGQGVIAAILRMPQGWIRRELLGWVIREACMGSLNRRDFTAIAAALADDAVVIPPPEQAVLLGTHGHGRAALGRGAAESYWRAWLAEWAEFTIIPVEVLDLGDGRFVMLNQLTATGASSGVRIERQEEAELWEVRNGRVTRLQQWLDWNSALDAVGQGAAAPAA